MPCGTFKWSGINPVCDQCMSTSCCSQLAACDPAQPNSPCGALVACILNCASTDDACNNACQTTYSAGAAQAQALVDCANNSCADACSSAVCTSGLTTNNEGCDVCLTGSCCTQFSNCAADTACYDCLTGASTDCSNNALLAAVDSCYAGSCSAPCTTAICQSGLTTAVQACDSCLTTNCCAAFTNCHNDAACNACITGQSTNCSGNALYNATISCENTKCGGPC